MYHGPGSVPLQGVARTRRVCLPAGSCLWHDFWTGETHPGGSLIEAAAPLERIPLYVPAGGILPLTEPMQHIDERPEAPWELRVYRGADGDFELYEDAGDSYAYEQGECATLSLSTVTAATISIGHTSHAARSAFVTR